MLLTLIALSLAQGQMTASPPASEESSTRSSEARVEVGAPSDAGAAELPRRPLRGTAQSDSPSVSPADPPEAAPSSPLQARSAKLVPERKFYSETEVVLMGLGRGMVGSLLLAPVVAIEFMLVLVVALFFFTSDVLSEALDATTAFFDVANVLLISFGTTMAVASAHESRSVYGALPAPLVVAAALLSVAGYGAYAALTYAHDPPYDSDRLTYFMWRGPSQALAMLALPVLQSTIFAIFKPRRSVGAALTMDAGGTLRLGLPVPTVTAQGAHLPLFTARF